MQEPQHVFLIPGFFGFVGLGEDVYFGHVVPVLRRQFARLEREVEIHQVTPPATASIRRRAAHLLEKILESSASDRGAIHLVGHSVGGLDARLLATPGVALTADLDALRVAKRIRKVATISTPHLGTPLADALLADYPARFLQLLSLFTLRTLRRGLDLDCAPLQRIAELVPPARTPPGEDDPPAVAHVREALLDGCPPQLKDAASASLDVIGHDHELLTQITPAGSDLFDATAADRSTARYGSVVTAVPAPGLRSVTDALPSGSCLEASQRLFATLYRLTADQRAAARRQLDGEQAERLQRAFGGLPGARDNDGIVPTLSQVHGEVIHAARADHLDAIGHFDDPDLDPPHHNWLDSGAAFGRAGFERLWNAVATFITDEGGEAA